MNGIRSSLRIADICFFVLIDLIAIVQAIFISVSIKKTDIGQKHKIWVQLSIQYMIFIVPVFRQTGSTSFSGVREVEMGIFTGWMQELLINLDKNNLSLRGARTGLYPNGSLKNVPNRKTILYNFYTSTHRLSF